MRKFAFLVTTFFGYIAVAHSCREATDSSNWTNGDPWERSSSRAFDSLYKKAKREAEISGARSLIVPSSEGSVYIYRKVRAGDTFWLYGPGDTEIFKATYSGWQEFLVRGPAEWQGRNPKLYAPPQLKLDWCDQCPDSIMFME